MSKVIPVQANPCIVLFYASHLGCTEGQLVEAVCSLSGNLKYPNSLVNAMVVSHKYYTALRKNDDGELNVLSETVDEYHAPDCQMFVGLISEQIAPLTS